MAGISILATISFLFIRKPVLFIHKFPDINDHVPANLRRSFSVVKFEGSSERGNFFAAAHYSTDASKNMIIGTEPSFKEDIKSVLKLLVSKRMRPILP